LQTNSQEALAGSPDIGGRDEDWHRADIVCGGFPCQDVSYAGRGAGITGSRSGLWRWLCGAIRMVRPIYAVVENVAALLDRGMGRVLGDLAEIGYDAEWHCIPASNVGLPHIRDRVWIVAHDRGEREQGEPAPALSDLYRIPWGENERRATKWRDRPDLHEPWLCRTGDGIRERLDALGNAVVPQIPEIIGKAILQAEASH
jgi:DNA (cytosine-5)-methyltransferase 1